MGFPGLVKVELIASRDQMEVQINNGLGILKASEYFWQCSRKYPTAVIFRSRQDYQRFFGREGLYIAFGGIRVFGKTLFAKRAKIVFSPTWWRSGGQDVNFDGCILVSESRLKEYK